MKKTESVAEFLARGGKITKVPQNMTAAKADVVKSTTRSGGPATIVSLDEADLYHGEQKKRKAKKKVVSQIDVSALPEELRRKFVDKVINERNQEQEEENE